MRQTKLTLVCLILAIASTISSCKKTEGPAPVSESTFHNTALARTTAETDVTVSDDGYLIFASEDVYEAKLQELAVMNDDQLNTWEEEMGYHSLRSELVIENPENPFPTLNRTAEDDLFRTIINKDGLIQIGNYLFKAEIDNSYVSEMNANNVDYLPAFKAGEFIEGVSNRFDLDEDEVFIKLDNGLTGYKSGNKAPIFGTGDKYNDDQTGRAEGTCTILRADTKIAYQKAVFYFSLMAELKHMWRNCNGGIWWHNWGYAIDIELNKCDYYWKNKKNNTGSNPAYFQLEHNNSNKLNFRAYSGSRGLKDYYMKANFWYDGIFNQWSGPRNMRMVPYNFYIHS